MANWYEQGIAVSDLEKACPDAPYYLDSDFEHDYGCSVLEMDWRVCQVPLTAYGLCSGSLDQHLTELMKLDPAYEEMRLGKIRSWVASVGGMQAALAASPVLTVMKGHKLIVVDGWHRLGLAAFEHKLSNITALCGRIP